MQYTEVDFTLTPASPWNDVLAAELGEIGFESFVTTDEGLTAYISSDQFNEEEMKKVETLNSELVKASYVFRPYQVQNWNEEWEKNFSPIEIDTRCIVYASFHTIEKEYDYRILIDPKMSFGTGHHATTFLMLSSLLELNVENHRVLDMGCGTAVLAILARMKGATDLKAIDNNEWAYTNSKENVEKNNLDKIDVLLGEEELIGDDPYDTILANINKNIILNQLPIYAKALKTGGTLLTSGFYHYDVKDIQAKAEECGLEFVLTRTDRNWSVIQFTKS